MMPWQRHDGVFEKSEERKIECDDPKGALNTAARECEDETMRLERTFQV